MINNFIIQSFWKVKENTLFFEILRSLNIIIFKNFISYIKTLFFKLLYSKYIEIYSCINRLISNDLTFNNFQPFNLLQDSTMINTCL